MSSTNQPDVAAVSTPAPLLEPATADHRQIWDMYFGAHIMPVVALCDEIGIFALLEARKLELIEGGSG